MFEDDIAQTCRHVAQLASTLCRRRRYAEAKQLISDVIKLRANVLGVHHDETDQARQQLATLLKENETRDLVQGTK